MNKQHNIDDITSVMQELDYFINQIKKQVAPNGTFYNMPDIEIDLALEKTRKLYSELLNVQKFKSLCTDKSGSEVIKELELVEIKPAPAELKVEVKEPIHAVVEPVTVPIVAPILESVAEPVIVPVVESVIEKMKDEISVPIIETKIAETVKQDIPETKKEVAPKVVVEPVIENKKSSIIDVISQTATAEDFVTKLQQKPINDINEAIGLGEKLLYINELFDKKLENYTASVKELNGFTHFDEAMAYINSNFSWNMEKESTINFLEIVKRKFPN